MRLRLPGSLAGRLLVTAAVLILAAILVAASVMGFTLQRFVTGQLDQRLDAQALAIRSALRTDGDGRLVVSSDIDPPPFDRPGAPWIWQVEDGDGLRLLSSRSLRPNASIEILSQTVPQRRPQGRSPRDERSPRDGPPPPDMRVPGDLAPQATAPQGAAPSDDGDSLPPEPRREPRVSERRPRLTVVVARDQAGRMLHGRRIGAEIEGRSVAITVFAPQAAIDGPMLEALTPLLVSMLVLAIGLVAALWAQVRLGLKPLARLRDDLSAVRAGQARHVPLEQPIEVRPLAEELNSLIDENEAGLERARRHVANLAHGLKTPLADLQLTLRAPGRDPDGAIEALVADMDRRVRYHLGRARAAAVGGASRATTPLKPHADDLVGVLSRIHQGRAFSVALAVPADMTVACEPQDLDEMVGNLLDNAFKWAAGRIELAARRDGAFVRLSIDDDGHGIDEAALPEALVPGRRLDEMTPGHGFGLSITRELAELYGGGLSIGRSRLGGLSATITLPVPRGS